MKKATVVKPVESKKPVIKPTQLVPAQPAGILAPERIINISEIVTKSKAITVVTTDEQLTTVDFVDGLLAEMIKTVEADLKGPKQEASKEHKRICKIETDSTKELIAERRRISGLVLDCFQERRIAAEEKARLESVENARLAREKAEKDREARLEVLVLEGKDDEVAELLVEDVVVENVAAVKVESTVPTGLGMHSVSRWVGEVYDLRMLLQAVLDGKASMGTVEQPGVIMVNQPYLNKLASLDKSTLMIPGVRAKDVGGTSR